MRKNLQHITLNPKKNKLNNKVSTPFVASESHDIQTTYSKVDIENLEHLNFAAGIPPFLRGSSSTMYVQRPWAINPYTDYSGSQKKNASFEQSSEKEHQGISMTFDLATQRGFNSDHPAAAGDVGKSGVAIDSVEDMKKLFNEISLDKTSVSIPLDGAVLPIMAFFIVAAQERGIAIENLSGMFQSNTLKELTDNNTSIYPPQTSMKIMTDIFEFTSKNMPFFNSICISGHHLHEVGASCDIELAYTLANGLQILRQELNTGVDIDSLAPRLSFFWAIGMNHFKEIAKMRAARMLWAKIIKQFNPKEEKSLALDNHCQISGCSLTQQEPYNNITRTTIEAAAAAFGGTQSLDTNSLEKKIPPHADLFGNNGLKTQLFLQEETKITKTVDPWAGSYYLEKLTHDIAKKAWQHLEEIESLGGMSKAIETGLPQIRIDKAIADKQASIESGQNVIVGVNKHRLDKDPAVKLDTNQQSIKSLQIAHLKTLQSKRDSKNVSKAISKLTEASRLGQGNLLALAIDAARERATIGEISGALDAAMGPCKA